MSGIRLGLVGIGKIARDQHVPALISSSRFELAATASREGRVDGVPRFTDIAKMIAAAGGELEAVSICTPPDGRFDQAVAAIDAGPHVMLEKPPCATVSEIASLSRRARDRGVSLFATWHSREAAGVEPARSWLAGKQVRSARIVWKEDIRRWHPGQSWILARAGFGVFDPAINALSIATLLLSDELALRSAWMEVPFGCGAPLRARLQMCLGSAPVNAEFDFLKEGAQIWDLVVTTDEGTLTLSEGGRILELGDGTRVEGADREYSRLYDRFADLIASGCSDVDVRPLQLVADAFLVADVESGAPFAF